jgi:L-fuconolactonase
MQKIDAHQHFWHYSPEAYHWISDHMSVLKRDFLPADLQPLLQANGYAGCIAVQASQTEEETEFLLKLAEQHDFIKGVVGWVDLQDYSVKLTIKKWADHPKLCGFRHIIQDEPDDQFMLRPEFMRGVKALGAFNLPYDILIFEKHLPATLQFVSYLPDMKLVVDHIAKPKIKQHELQNLRHGHRSRLAALERRRFPALPGHHRSSFWHRSTDGRL